MAFQNEQLSQDSPEDDFSMTVRGLSNQYLRAHVWYGGDEEAMLERVRADFMGDYKLLYEGHNEPLPAKQSFDFRDPEDPVMVQADVYYNSVLPPEVAADVEIEYNKSLDFEKFIEDYPDTIWHDENYVQTSEEVDFLWTQLRRDHEQGTFAGDEHLVQMFNRLYHTIWNLEHIKMLCRFADVRQTPLDRVPLPDGTNIPSLSLRIQWLARRRWIRFLHRSSLTKGKELTAKIEIAGILRDSHGFLEEEIQRVVGNQNDPASADYWRPQPPMGDYQLAPEFEWLVEVGNEIYASVERSAHSLGEHTERFLGDSATVKDLFCDKDAWGAAIEQIHGEFLGGLKPISYVVFFLLETGQKFEKSLKISHVEDYLREKRIVEFDDEEWYRKEQRLPTFNEMSMEADVFTSFMELIGTRNNQRRDHHILRDWIRARPFGQLYRVFDSGSNPAVKKGMADLRSRGVARRQAKRDQINPSSTENVLSQILLVHPLDMQEIGTDHWPNDEMLCAICQEDFVANETLITAACEAEHLFHMRCLFRYNDRFGVVQYSCPLDRQHFSLQSATVGIAALRESSYGHHHWVDGLPYTGNNPQFKYSHVNLQGPPEEGTPLMAIDHPFWQKQMAEEYASAEWEQRYHNRPLNMRPRKPTKLLLSDRRAARRSINDDIRQDLKDASDSIWNMT